MKILIYANCQGYLLSKFFESYNKLYNKNFIIHYFSNYNIIDKNIENKFNNILKNCDVFIYQHNKGNTNIKYDINLIKDTCIKIKIVWWIFNGFWIDSTYNPYKQIIYNNIKYIFLELEWNNTISQLYGIHNSFINFYGNYNEVKNKINNLHIDKDYLVNYFNDECDKFKNIDINSDISMFDYFIQNYKNEELFHCPIHPTNNFFYELFKKIILYLKNCSISIDLELLHKFNLNDLLEHSLLSYSRPILPIVKDILNINYNNNFKIFYSNLVDITLNLDIYQYYFIRLSPSHFKIFMDLKNNNYNDKRTINYNIYRINYDDLSKLNNNEIINHYNKYALIENRNDNFVDLNFNWKIYLYMNHDLNFKTMEECYKHYLKHGKKENRLPSYNDNNFIWNTSFDEYDEYIKYSQKK
jgi:hypothetical protein